MRGDVRSAISSRIRSFSDHIDARHHAVIFVFEIVAMKKIPSAVSPPAHNHLDDFIAINGDSVFPATLFGARRLPIPSQNLKRHEVSMNRMQHRAPTKTTTYESPDLDIAQTGLCINALRIKGFSVDDPADTRWQRQRR